MSKNFTENMPNVRRDTMEGSKAEDNEQRNEVAIQPNESLNPPGAQSPPPDGGFQAWMQVVGVFFCWFNSWYVELHR